MFSHYTWSCTRPEAVSARFIFHHCSTVKQEIFPCRKFPRIRENFPSQECSVLQYLSVTFAQGLIVKLRSSSIQKFTKCTALVKHGGYRFGNIHPSVQPYVSQRAHGWAHGCYQSEVFVCVLVTRGVAVSRVYDTCFSVKACDGLYQLLKSIGSGWNTIWVSIDRVDLCQTHCKQVPDFFRLSGSHQITWVESIKQVNTRGYPPVPAFGSIWGVLWLLFFRSAPSTFQ